MGTMTSYSSFNPVDKPIIGDGFKIAFINAGISFFSGFAVFSTVGYLVGIGSPVAGENQSIGLAFVAYPAAIETMPAPNLWAFILSVTLFTLGIDSSFSMLEACATVMQDSPMFKKWSRKVIALFLVFLGCIGSIFFSFNWGFTFFAVVDNYLNVYLMLVLGVLETMGAAWVYEAADIFAKGRKYKVSLLILAAGYWVAVFAVPIGSVFSDSGSGWVGMPIFWGWLIIVWIVSFIVSKLSFAEWRSNIMFYGVRKLSRAMTKLSKASGDTKIYWWEPVFEYWWGFSIKYFVPFALNFLIFYSLNIDLNEKFGDYHMFWQVCGFCFPIAGLLTFFISFCVCKEPEPFDHDVDAAFDEKDHAGMGAESSMAALVQTAPQQEGIKKEAELAKLESIPQA